ncbi:GntR family transcriptional regulator [Clostridium sp. cel8]|jgi:GntR family transcriptional regulator|uniref:GntR family transcriptional regulator n=1 Tax=unclassified Clostridium TaxID=2614128 RepID=UPI0015F69789|nr:GntR family transcriptional regulator [Clostridium sp. cel8]MBA5851206.1 GntR family transcriptional regulator [Clostridium sp. cel8]
MNKIDKNSKTPLYIQLMDILINKIENYMKENDQLDSEREICQKYSVSRTTVRQALDELEKERYIYKVHGKGNFVSSRRMEQKLLKVYSFTDEMKKLGKNPTSDLLGFEIAIESKEILKKLNIKEDELVYKISRIRLADDIPMLYEVTYLPYKRFKGLTREMLMQKSLYEIFKDDFNINIISAEESIEGILINKLESAYLNVPEGQAGLKVERITYSYKQVIEYTKTIARGDKFKYRVSLKNQ